MQKSNTVQRQSKFLEAISLGNGYIGFPYYPLVRAKRHGTACNIAPKGEVRTHGTACAIGPKCEARILGPRATLGPYIQEVIYMGWV